MVLIRPLVIAPPALNRNRVKTDKVTGNDVLRPGMTSPRPSDVEEWNAVITQSSAAESDCRHGNSVRYGLYRVQQANSARQALASLKGIDWWSHPGPMNHPGDVMVPKGQRLIFEGTLAAKKIPYQLLSDNVQLLIVAERQRQAEAERKGKADSGITFDKYYSHAEMNAYLDKVAAAHPDIAKVETVGKSFEGREMKGVKLSSGGTGKPLVFVDGGIHAREWIASAMALYLIQEITEGSAKDLLESVDWVILPLVNPDGYEYSRNEDRMWRKTRSVIPSEDCIGTDPNRNFDFHWMESGASDDPCSDIFAGEKAFSEPEARALRDYVLANAKNAKAYLTLHSYGQYILYPWGYDTSLPDDWKDLDDLGNAINDAISSVRGTTYEVGSSGQALYPAAGASDDWSKGVAKVKYVYTIELPGGGFYGFDLPASDIAPVVQETLEGIRAHTLSDPAAGASDDWSKGVAKVKYVYTIELPGGGFYGFDLPASDIAPVVQETLEGIRAVGRTVAKA
ncbi:carboxypeptidase B-like [Hetaerina americana]|uniref:carboxypeptidase B-like n=1 Tax=Hetaerina americana TaxID=62018 RepID=UPI003A7F4B8D